MKSIELIQLQLFAKVDRLQSMGGQFRKGSKTFDAGDVLLWVVVLIVIGLMLWLLTQFKERQDGPRAHQQPSSTLR